MNTIFDENGLLNLADIVTNHPSYLQIMADGVVTDEELKEQSERTIKALHKVQDICTPEQQSAIMDAISEMSVLFATYHIHELHDLK